MIGRHGSGAAFIAAGVFLVWTGIGAATTILPFTTEQITVLADRVVVGKVLLVKSSAEGKSSSAGQSIESEVLISVEEYLKSDVRPEEAPPFVQVAVPGGIVGERGTLVHGAPAFAEGERVVVFLEKKDEAGIWSITGFSQGKFGIESGARGSEKVIGKLGRPDAEWVGGASGTSEMEFQQFRTRISALARLQQGLAAKGFRGSDEAGE